MALAFIFGTFLIIRSTGLSLCRCSPRTSLQFNLSGKMVPVCGHISSYDIGTPSSLYNSDPEDTLVCLTSRLNRDCCRNQDNFHYNRYGGEVGKWYYPNGDPVPQFNRSSPFNEVLFHRQIRLARANKRHPILPGWYRCEVQEGSSGIIYGISIFIFSKGFQSEFSSPVGLRIMFNNTEYLPNNNVTVTYDDSQANDTEEDPETALICDTSKFNSYCCKETMNVGCNTGPVGKWYYPDETVVPESDPNSPFRVVRDIHKLKLVRANRSIPVPTGIYTCEIPHVCTGNMNVSINLTLPEDLYSTEVNSEYPTTENIPSNMPLDNTSTVLIYTTTVTTSSSSNDISVITTSTGISSNPVSSITSTSYTEVKHSSQRHGITDALSQNMPDGRLMMTYIGASIGVGFGLLLLAIIFIIFICPVRKRAAKQNIIARHTTVTIHQTNSAPERDEFTESFTLSMSMPVTLKEKPLPVPTWEFSDHIAHMQEDRNKLYEVEFDAIGRSANPDSSVAQIPANMERNRFINVYPYNFNRVILNTIPGVDNSDYINASYINGYGRNKVYVAAQGPKEETVEDFWRMIWGYSIPTIVMLTRLFERKKKCEKYWPESVGEVRVLNSENNFKVKLDSSQPFPEYVVRKMTVSKGNSPGFEVTMFHYLAWPDHGVPSNAMSMVNFIKRVRKTHPYSKEDLLLVHCSAGVGRTGTFITLDYMLERIKKEKNINIYEFVDGLRRQRVHMVQTLSQYIFIHKAMHEFCLCGETEILSSNLRIVINRLSKEIESQCMTGFQEQFNTLEIMTRQVSPADVSDATVSTNMPLNRYEDKLPFNQTRVHLRSHDSQNSDYINASYIEGYKKTGSYIATQGPLPHTVSSFWRMVWEQQIKCIVMLCEVEENKEIVCNCYWPENDENCEIYDNLSVTLSDEEHTEDYTVRKLLISKSCSEKPTNEERVKVIQFQYLKWPDKSVPSMTSSILQVASLVQKIQISTGNKPILVLCNDGVGRSGTFITLHAQIERIKAEGIADIFQFIKAIRFQRANMVTNEKQYEFCHRVLADFLDEFDTYANFKELV